MVDWNFLCALILHNPHVLEAKTLRYLVHDSPHSSVQNKFRLYSWVVRW